MWETAIDWPQGNKYFEGNLKRQWEMSTMLNQIALMKVNKLLVKGNYVVGRTY